MRRKVKKYKEYEQRTIEKFLWFPLELRGDWRWLERVKIRQEARYDLWFSLYFVDLAFVESESEIIEGNNRPMPECLPPKSL